MRRVIASTILLLVLLVGWGQAEHNPPPAQCRQLYEAIFTIARETPVIPPGLDASSQAAFLAQWKADRTARREAAQVRYQQCLHP